MSAPVRIPVIDKHNSYIDDDGFEYPLNLCTHHKLGNREVSEEILNPVEKDKDLLIFAQNVVNAWYWSKKYVDDVHKKVPANLVVCAWVYVNREKKIGMVTACNNPTAERHERVMGARSAEIEELKLTVCAEDILISKYRALYESGSVLYSCAFNISQNKGIPACEGCLAALNRKGIIDVNKVSP